MKPETGHPGVRQGVPLARRGVAPRADRSRHDTRRRRRGRRHDRREHDRDHGFGLQLWVRDVDPIGALSDLALERGVGLHVDGCLGGFILPWGQELGYDIPVFDFRIPGVTSISADTHKYGYGFKGSSVLAFRDISLRDSQYFFMTDWTGGSTHPRHRRLPVRRPARGHVGRDGELRADGIPGVRPPDLRDRVRDARRGAVAPRAADRRNPTFCFSFTSDEFDIYHVNDFMRTRGWRFNGQQYPNGIHMAVTRPQTQPGVADTFAADLAEAVPYAVEHKGDKPPEQCDLRWRGGRDDRGSR